MPADFLSDQERKRYQNIPSDLGLLLSAADRPLEEEGLSPRE
jgi:hypothetical protein